MVEHDGTGGISVSRQVVEDVDKEAEVTPMSVQGEQTASQEERKEATSDLTAVPTTIMAMMTTTAVRRARFLEDDVNDGIDGREKEINTNKIGNMQFDMISK